MHLFKRYLLNTSSTSCSVLGAAGRVVDTAERKGKERKEGRKERREGGREERKKKGRDYILAFRELTVSSESLQSHQGARL